MFGIRIIEVEAMRDTVIDSSGCRSPSRAMRRWRRRGIRGRLAISYKPWTHALKTPQGMMMHPVMAAELRKCVRQQESARSHVNPLFIGCGS